MNASTQLRALEGEIERMKSGSYIGVLARSWDLLQELAPIAKDMEKERDELRREVSEDNETIRLQHVLMKNAEARVSAKTSEEIASLRTENATLKRRLDEAMKELATFRRSDGHNVGCSFDSNGTDPDSDFCDCKMSVNSTLKRITEIDKL